MKCQSLISGETKENIISFSSAEYAQREVRVRLSDLSATESGNDLSLH